MSTSQRLFPLFLTATFLLVCAQAPIAQEPVIAVFDLGTARLSIDAKGYPGLQVGTDNIPWPPSVHPILRLGAEKGLLLPESVTAGNGRLTALFPGGAVCEMAVMPGAGFLVFEVTRLEAPGTTRLRPVSYTHLQLPTISYV